MNNVMLFFILALIGVATVGWLFYWRKKQKKEMKMANYGIQTFDEQGHKMFDSSERVLKLQGIRYVNSGGRQEIELAEGQEPFAFLVPNQDFGEGGGITFIEIRQIDGKCQVIWQQRAPISFNGTREKIHWNHILYYGSY